MSAVWAWIRHDLRSRARSLAVLALLVALTTGVVLTAVAGSRRGSTAAERLLEQTRPATVAALPNEPGFDWDEVAALPEVATIARFAVSSYGVEGLPPEEGADFPYADATIMRDIERVVVLDGRLADPTRDDEAVVTQAFEGTYGKGVGDTITITLFTPEQVDARFAVAEETAPAGPRIETRIVGVVRSPWFSDTGDGERGRLIPSPGLFTQHRANLLGAKEKISINALVRLEHGAADIPKFREDLAQVSGRRDVEFFNLAEDADHAIEVADFEGNALLAFAAAALIAALFLVGQSVARYVTGGTQDLQVLLAVGMPPRHVRLGAAAGPTLAAVIGAAIGVAGAFVASSSFPTGTAAPLEPSPGRHGDLVVLGAGLALIPLLVAAGALLASWSASRGLAVDRGARRSRLASRVARTGAPVSVSVGTSFALDRGRGAQAVPVYPALVGAVVGVLGVVSALTFAAGVNDASSHPERFGQISQLQVFLGFSSDDFVPTDQLLPVLAQDPDVLAVNNTRQGVLESGSVDLPAFVIDPVDAPPPIVVIEGRLPTSDDEVTIATKSAQDLDAGVGDTIELTGSKATGRYTVSGIAFVPEGSHNAYDSGAWVRVGTYDGLIEGFKFHIADVTLREGADPDVVSARAGMAVVEALGFPEDIASDVLQPVEPPSRLAELREIRRLPLLLAAFLALLAVAAVGHALATAVRRRRHDLAVLRAVGVTRWQSRATVLIQATLMALVGLSVGVPLGFALGRSLWRSVADTTPLDYVPPLAVWALLLVAPVALLAANLLAAWPSQRAASMRVASVLRTE